VKERQGVKMFPREEFNQILDGVRNEMVNKVFDTDEGPARVTGVFGSPAFDKICLIVDHNGRKLSVDVPITSVESEESEE
jgi:hypothetical protein